MRIAIVGPGRAGMSVAIAADAAGHDVVAVMGRSRSAATEPAALVDAAPLGPAETLPPTDLLVIATRDAGIRPVAEQLTDQVEDVHSAVHLSGFTPVGHLQPLADLGLRTGSFHPLQTLPTAVRGAARLAGAWVAITAHEELQGELEGFARSLAMHPFVLRDEHKPAYHAAAAAAANFPLAALTMAHDLLESVDVPFEAAHPLVDAIVANAFTLGPRAALTGPVARGDVETVDGQLDAVHEHTPQWLAGYAHFVSELAKLTGRSEAFSDLLHRWDPET